MSEKDQEFQKEKPETDQNNDEEKSEVKYYITIYFL